MSTLVIASATWSHRPRLPPRSPAPPPPPPPPPAKCADSDNDGVCDEADKCPGTPAGTKVDSVGCPLEQTLKLLFDFDSAELRPELITELERVVKFMGDVPFAKAMVEGHTDSVGTEEYNAALSDRRAKAVFDYLSSRGVDPARLSLGWSRRTQADRRQHDRRRSPAESSRHADPHGFGHVIDAATARGLPTRPRRASAGAFVFSGRLNLRGPLPPNCRHSDHKGTDMKLAIHRQDIVDRHAGAARHWRRSPRRGDRLDDQGRLLTDDKALYAAVNGDWRTDEAKARDQYRHPVESLTFWGLKPGMTILEIQPGAQSWWTEILAPYAKMHRRHVLRDGRRPREPEALRRRPQGAQPSFEARYG